MPYQGNSWSVWRFQNGRTSNSYCEICRLRCVTGLGRNGPTGHSRKTMNFGAVMERKWMWKRLRLRESQSSHPQNWIWYEKQPENVEHSKYLGSMITKDAKYSWEIKSRIAEAKAAFDKKKSFFTGKLDLNLRNKLVKCCFWSVVLYGAETWTLRKVHRKYMESSEMWYWRGKEIRWADHVRNEEVLQKVKDRNILKTIKKKRNAKWIGPILCRYCLLKHFVEEKIEGRLEVTRRRQRRRKQLLYDMKQKRGYWKVKEEAFDRTLWRTRFGRVYGTLVRQTKNDVKIDVIANS